MAARLMLEQLAMLEARRNAVLELCRGQDAARVLAQLGAPAE
jgi:hypothetical protein